MLDVLLIVGMATAVLFLAVVLIEGAIRSGYNPVYHTGSELELGKRGWIQRANFFVVGLGMFAFAAGINQALDTLIGAVLLAIFGFGLFISGVFAPDPVRGYPPGAPIEPRAEPSWRARIHYVSGPVAFLAVLGACLAVALQLDAFWQWYTLVTAVAHSGRLSGRVRDQRCHQADCAVRTPGLAARRRLIDPLRRRAVQPPKPGSLNAGGGSNDGSGTEHSFALEPS